MRTARIVGVVTETDEIRTFYFRDALCSQASPGQYVMIWVPGIDEVPMSLSSMEPEGESSVTVQAVGEATRAIHGLTEGDGIGIRGPFGNGFTIVGSSPLIVGGGTGAASLTALVISMLKSGLRPTFVLGARTERQLPLRSRLERMLGNRLIPATDDGSYGFKGFASECARGLLNERRFDAVYTCGPELMMAAIFDEADGRGIHVQASLERYIKCAVGLCGSCAIGPYRVCRDGPVFRSDQLRTVRDEFGRLRMDPSGTMIEVDH